MGQSASYASSCLPRLQRGQPGVRGCNGSACRCIALRRGQFTCKPNDRLPGIWRTLSWQSAYQMWLLSQQQAYTACCASLSLARQVMAAKQFRNLSGTVARQRAFCSHNFDLHSGEEEGREAGTLAP